jgi:hypothetical protein
LPEAAQRAARSSRIAAVVLLVLVMDVSRSLL